MIYDDNIALHCTRLISVSLWHIRRLYNVHYGDDHGGVCGIHHAHVRIYAYGCKKIKNVYELVLITFFTCGDGHDDGCA